MRLAYQVVDVFTDRRFAGNPLAVLPDAEGLDTAAMQRIAAEFNLSETAFILPPTIPQALARVRIFTPRAEMAFAGHPTVGAALVMAELGRVPRHGDNAEFILEEGAGPVPVRITYDVEGPRKAEFRAPKAPEHGPPLDPRPIAEALGLHLSQLKIGSMPCVASCGTPFVIAELVDLEALAAASLTASPTLGDGNNGIFLVVRTAQAVWRARMFAPLHNIAEDPATGSAAAAFAGLLANSSAGPMHLTIHQGVEMGRPSIIHARSTQDDGVTAVFIAGAAVPVAEGTIEVDC